MSRNMKRIIKKLFATAILFSFVSFFAVTAVYAATNLITNPEFTTNVTGYNIGNGTGTRRDFTSSPNIAPTGGTDDFGLELATTSSNGQAYQSFAATAGDWYLATARIYSPSTNTHVNNGSVQIWNAGFATIVQSFVTAEDTWQTVVAGARATDATVRLAIRDQTPNAGDKSYFDAVSLQKLTYSEMISSSQTTGSDFFASVSVASSPRGTQAGLALSLDSASNPQNGVLVYHNGTQIKVEKMVAGVYSTLATVSSTFANNGIIQVRKTGSSYEVYYNRALINTYTIADAGIINNTIQGTFNTYSGNTLNNFSLVDAGTGSIIYIDSTCANNGDGSSQTCASVSGGVGPYNSFTEVNTLTGNLANLQILLKRGTTILGGINLVLASNFVIDAYGSGDKPIISAARTFNATWTQEGSLWYTAVESGKNYTRAFIVNGRKLDGVFSKSDLNTGQYKSWYDSGNSRHYIVLDGVINPNSATIQANSNDAGQDRNIKLHLCGGYRISNVYLQYGYQNNFDVTGSGNNVEVSNITSIGSGAFSNVYGADGIVIYGSSTSPATGVVIKNNISNGNQNNGMEIWGLDGATVSDNSMDGNGGGVEVWGYITNSTITRNIATNNTLPQTATASQNAGRGFWAAPTSQDVPNTGFNSNNTVSYNIFGTSYTVGMKIDQGTGWRVYNNIIYEVTRTGQYVVDVKNSGTSVDFTNNILANAHGNDTSNYFLGRFGTAANEVTLTGNNNDFYTYNGGANIFNPIILNGTQYSTFSSFKTASGQTNSMNVDPLFVSLSTPDFHLQSSSSLINSGANVGLTQAIDGTSVPQGSAFDIGAYEYTTPGPNNTPSSNSPTIPSCNDSAPIGIPDLFQIDVTANSAKLNFTTIQGVNSYSIVYGFKEGEERYGTQVSYSGPKWVLETSIKSLSPNTTYYFKIRPLNGCNGGSWSNSIAVKTTSGKQQKTYFKDLLSRVTSAASVLAGSTSVTSTSQPSNTAAQSTIDGCQYTIQSGDSLWTIAQRKYGKGSQYSQITELNPSLLSSSILKTGQSIILCQ